MRFMMMVIARVPDVVIWRTRDFAQSRMLAVAMARHRPSDCHRQQPFLSLTMS
jgi:hypothetical protein